MAASRINQLFTNALGSSPTHPTLTRSLEVLSLSDRASDFDDSTATEHLVHIALRALKGTVAQMTARLEDDPLEDVLRHIDHITASPLSSDALIQLQVELCSKTGILLQELSRSEDSIPWHERALELDGRLTEASRLMTATLWNNLGVACGAIGYLEKARDSYVTALALCGDDVSPHRSLNLNDLGNVAFALGDFQAAEQHYEAALANDEHLGGPWSTDVGIRVSNLGMVKNAKKDIVKARELFTRGAAIWTQAFGPDHPNVAADLNNLGVLEHQEGNTEEALSLFSRALEIERNRQPLNREALAVKLGNVGALQCELGRLEEAKQSLLEAFTLDHDSLGPDHPMVALRLENLAVIANALGDHETAQLCRSRSEQITNETLEGAPPEGAQV